MNCISEPTAPSFVGGRRFRKRACKLQQLKEHHPQKTHYQSRCAAAKQLDRLHLGTFATVGLPAAATRKPPLAQRRREPRSMA